VRVPPAIDTQALARRITTALVPIHYTVSLEGKRRQPDDFRYAAQAAADNLAAGGSPDDTRAVVASWAPEGGTSVERIADADTLVDDSRLVKLLHNPTATAFGVGVAQGKDREHGRGAVWVVIVTN
jgi:hypothetical protein